MTTITIQINWKGDRDPNLFHTLLDIPWITHVSSYFERETQKEILVLTLTTNNPHVAQVVHLTPGDTLNLNFTAGKEDRKCEVQLRRDSEGPPSEPVSMQESGQGMGLILT
jgi:hypothetical protein